MQRRSFLRLGGAAVALLAGGRDGRAEALATLLSAPLEVNGQWGGSPTASATLVISRMRVACLSGVRLLSDGQPQRLRVDDQASGPPHIWLHEENPDTAWIVVDIGAKAWSQLAYQFGHELGHVMCNSWRWKVETPPPSRWLEESLVEAFSIRGLARLADRWQRDPPFAGNAAYADAIRKYRSNLVEKYRQGTKTAPIADLVQWFRASRQTLNQAAGVGRNEGPAIVAILAELEADTGNVEDLGALNRWPERSALPLEDYLRRWRTSCAQIQSPGRLPARLTEIFGLT